MKTKTVCGDVLKRFHLILCVQGQGGSIVVISKSRHPSGAVRSQSLDRCERCPEGRG